MNLFLGLFNLLPIPPLDGSALLERVLPARATSATWYRFRPYGILVLFLLVFSTDVFERILDPFFDRLLTFVGGVSRVGHRLRHLVARFFASLRA